MNLDIATKWTAALRSGEFEQTMGSLQDEDGFCCLGVLCELYRRETGVGFWDGSGSYACKSFDTGDNREENVPPPEVTLWAGMRDANPTPPGTAMPLAEMNDQGKTFAELADLIDRHAADL